MLILLFAEMLNADCAYFHSAYGNHK